MNDERRHHQDIKFFLGVFIGGLLGALIIFLLGTKEGKKTGKILEKKGLDILDNLTENLEDWEEKGKELVAKGEDIKDEIVEQIEEKKAALTQTTTEKLDDALAHIEALQERGRQTTANLRRVFKNLPKR